MFISEKELIKLRLILVDIDSELIHKDYYSKDAENGINKIKEIIKETYKKNGKTLK